MARPTNDVLAGTLDVLVLKALSWEPLHGYGVAKWIQTATDDMLSVGEGTLYPALHRLEERGLVESAWSLSENNRRAKFYRLTAAGRRAVRTDVAAWTRYATAIMNALTAPGS
jgi:PadR family transcriptional regulator, regulatory protein PadR